MSDHFQVLSKDPNSDARRGRLQTLHGQIETPIFMPVGTQGTVKGLTPQHLKEIDAQIILGNTYHLNLRPGSELIREAGGLHTFMGWDGPILTDSGGFQAFSLAKLSKITDEGVAFQSHLDGANVFLGPKEVIEIQSNLASDIAMVIDECPPWPCERDDCEKAVDRTSSWALACKEHAESVGFLSSGHHLFAIVQGSSFEDLRKRSAEVLVELDFPGYAIGGVSVGEPEPEMMRQVAATCPFLPDDKPRYTMGLGTPPQMLKMIGLGIDMFDCVLPSRVARNGAFFTSSGMKNIRNAQYARDHSPLAEDLDNYTNRHFSKAYLRHLTLAKEMLGCTLITIHNLSFYLKLMKEARSRIEAGDFHRWSLEWIERYETGDEKTS